MKIGQIKKIKQARYLAIQTLYSWLIKQQSNPIQDEMTFYLTQNTTQVDVSYYTQLTKELAKKMDGLIAKLLPYIDYFNWDELDAIEQAILLLATYEFTYNKELDFPIIINEAVNLAKIFAGTDAYKFINGVLDKLFKSLPPTPKKQEYIDFILENNLPKKYLRYFDLYFVKVAQLLAEKLKDTQPLVIGITAPLATGKTTFVKALQLILKLEEGIDSANVSLDDFYLGKQQRKKLANDIHPLLQKRGVPGTHNQSSLKKVINYFHEGVECEIPVFNKLDDDVVSKRILPPCPILFIDGWCLGCKPFSEEELEQDCNDLEKNEDKNKVWRNYVQQNIIEYQNIFNQFDLMIKLDIPKFELVQQWRVKQEALLVKNDKTKKGMSEEEVAQFIMYFQRISEQIMYHFEADIHLSINENHEFIQVKTPNFKS